MSQRIRMPMIRARLAIATGALLLIAGRPGIDAQGSSRSGARVPATAGLLVWPLPPEAPRIRYVMTYRGADDFETKKPSRWKTLLLGPDESSLRLPETMIKPYGVAVAPDGRVFVTDTVARRVFAFDTELRKDTFIGEQGNGRLTKPIGVAVDGDGRVFVADATLGRVFAYSPTAQLVKVADGFQVWSETFTRDLKDIFAVQDEIARRAARALQLTIGEGENLAAGATRNPAAYEAYLRGREAANGQESGAREGVRLQQEAIGLGPGFALAHAALADSYVDLAKTAREQRDKAYPLARAAAERALALDKRIVPAHIALGEYAFDYAWDWDEADRQLRMALAIDPNHYHALGHFSTHELARGRFDSALDAVRKAEERNPLFGTTERQWILIGMKRYDEAIRLARKDLADRPGSKESLGYLGVALVLAGRHDEGLRVLEERAAAQPDSTRSQAVLGWAYGRAGQATKAHAVLQRNLAPSVTEFHLQSRLK